MAVIKKNMADVPDEIPPLDAGIYVFKVVKEELVTLDDNDKYNPGKDQLQIQLQVNSEGHPMHGRMQFDRITLGTDQGDVAFKRLIKSCGLIPGANFDTADLVDKNCRAEVVNRAGKGENAGKMYANIKQYIF